MARDDTPNTASVGATERSFRIIEQLGEREGCGVSELAESLSISKSTVHNHLQTLRELGVRRSGRRRVPTRAAVPRTGRSRAPASRPVSRCQARDGQPGRGGRRACAGDGRGRRRRDLRLPVAGGSGGANRLAHRNRRRPPRDLGRQGVPRAPFRRPTRRAA